MRERIGKSPWLSALAAWTITTGAVTLGYFVWTRVQQAPFLWSDVQFVALVAAALALFRAWRDGARRQQ